VVVSVEPQRLSSQELDILPMENRYELGINGRDVRFIWECFELECGRPVSLPVRGRLGVGGSNVLQWRQLGLRG
jgi:hypothetical protein